MKSKNIVLISFSIANTGLLLAAEAEQSTKIICQGGEIVVPKRFIDSSEVLSEVTKFSREFSQEIKGCQTLNYPCQLIRDLDGFIQSFHQKTNIARIKSVNPDNIKDLLEIADFLKIKPILRLNLIAAYLDFREQLKDQFTLTDIPNMELITTAPRATEDQQAADRDREVLIKLYRSIIGLINSTIKQSDLGIAEILSRTHFYIGHINRPIGIIANKIGEVADVFNILMTLSGLGMPDSRISQERISLLKFRWHQLLPLLPRDFAKLIAEALGEEGIFDEADVQKYYIDEA